jgi:hypothetical protein
MRITEEWRRYQWPETQLKIIKKVVDNVWKKWHTVMEVEETAMTKYNVTVSCITDNPNVNTKIEVIESKDMPTAIGYAEYLFGKARIIYIEVMPEPAKFVGMSTVDGELFAHYTGVIL